MGNKTTLKPLKIGDKAGLLSKKSKHLERQALIESLSTEAGRKTFIDTNFSTLNKKAQEGLYTIISLLIETK